MPAVFDMLVHSYGYKPNHAWRLAFYLPGCLHIFGGLLCFIFGQDHPDGRTAEVKATSGVSLKDDMVSEGWGVWVDWSGSGSAGAGARARAPLHPHPPPTAHCQPANPPPRLPAHPPTRPPAHPHPRSQGALVMPLMARGFQRGLVRFVLIAGTKPAAGG